MKSTDAVSTIDRLRLETWPVARLIPSARNARTHNDAQVAEIAGSIRAFGFSNPILVGPDGDIIAGHGHLAAARRLGLDEVRAASKLALGDNNLLLFAFEWRLYFQSAFVRALGLFSTRLRAPFPFSLVACIYEV